MQRSSFIFYESFYNSIAQLDKQIQADVILALVRYGLKGETEPNLKPVAKALFISMKHYIDRQGVNGGFKGANSDEIRLIRNSSEIKNWRKSVFKRDKYTCQKCGKVGGELNAHHIKPFASFPDLRTDISNGLTLCKNCHINIHKKQ